MKKLMLFLFFLATTTYVFAQDDSDMEKQIPAEETDTIDIEDIDFDDIDFDEIEEDELSKESSFPWNRFAVGGQLGQLQFGDVTNVGVAPEILYNVNNNLSVGVDGVFQLTRINRFSPDGFNLVEADYRSGNLGGRLFTRYTPVTSFPIFAQVEYERLNQEYPYGQLFQGGVFTFPSVEQTVGNVNAGLGFYNGPYYIGLMYNFMHTDNRDEFFDLAEQDAGGPLNLNNQVYPLNAISFRTGINIPLGQGDKNKKRDKNKKKKDEEDPSKEN